MLFAESPTATFSNAIAKIKGDCDGRCPWLKPRDSSQHLRLRKLTLDDRLLSSVRAIHVEEARETMMILSRIDECPIYTRGKVYITSSKHVESSFIRRKSGKDRLYSSKRTFHQLLQHVALCLLALSYSTKSSPRDTCATCRSYNAYNAPMIENWASADFFFPLCNGMLSVFTYLINIEFKIENCLRKILFLLSVLIFCF